MHIANTLSWFTSFSVFDKRLKDLMLGFPYTLPLTEASTNNSTEDWADIPAPYLMLDQ